MSGKHFRQEQERLQGDRMSKSKHTAGTKQKHRSLRPMEMEQKESAALKKAQKKFPNVPVRARVEADIILMAELSQRGMTYGR